MIKTKRGFSLLEVMITLVLIALVISLIFPSYMHTVIKARRSDGEVALQNLAGQMERYYSENNNSYIGATLSKLQSKDISQQGYYRLNIELAKEDDYLIQAVPLGSQAKYDDLCKTLTLNHLGQKGQTGTGTLLDCWG